jgi:LmbE family N-acetylglucosaminyl deacetylase
VKTRVAAIFDETQCLRRLWRTLWFGLFCLTAFGFTRNSSGAEPSTNSAATILHDLQSFRQLGSVLYIAAHPDDENTELIAYLARGRDYRTAYLSLTRGDGGQNVLGPDFGDKLGVARTQELLAARRIDGGRQFFSRAVDFGFSKDYRETLNIWDQQEVLSDIVRVIREFRPDVIITRFSPVPGGTHGHHTASTVLALEAFKLAGDPKAFPEQGLPPWQPERILWNVSSFQRDKDNGTNRISIDAGGRDSVSGETFADIAGQSRSMHKTQGFGAYRSSGGNGGSRTESFQFLDGSPATNDILDGVDTTWNRVPGGAEIGKLADEIITRFDPQDPSASVPALLNLRSNLFAFKSTDSIVAEKSRQLDRILQDCLGLSVETTIAIAEVVPGEELKLHSTAIVRSSVPVIWNGRHQPTAPGRKLVLDEPASQDLTFILPTNTPLTQPYWLREEPAAGTFRVEDPNLIGRPENPPVFTLNHLFFVAGQGLLIPDEPVQIITNSTGNGIHRRLDVIPPVSLKFASDVRLFSPGGSNFVKVEVVAARSNSMGTLQLEVPAGWKISPEKQPFDLKTVGELKQFTFTVIAPPESTTVKIIACAEIDGVRYRNQREELAYPHIPRQLLQPLATLKAVSLDLAIRGKKVGYIAGAGDTVAGAIQQMGYDVTMLGGDDLTTNRLKDFDAVVIGVRAFNVRTDLAAKMPALFAFVESGGTLIEQYNRPNDLKTDKLAPYDLHLSGDRVTDENAAVTFLAPEHPVLNAPNKITPADFDGWVQERGIYFPNHWDDHFTPILACNDAGESPLKGGLLVAQYGKGYFIYTGLVFFRELPAGVPGAYRLFANLVSLGK